MNDIIEKVRQFAEAECRKPTSKYEAFKILFEK